MGTSTQQETKEYFNNLQRHKIIFKYTDKEDEDKFDLLFNKKKADERKKWLETYNRNLVVDHS